jgi:cell wall-associated NlpC family hydrolase
MSSLRRALSAACISATVMVVGLADPALAAAPSPAKASSSTRTASAGYVVKNGDYLSGIATRLGVKLGDLLKANDLKSSSLIIPGMSLKVPQGGSLPAAPPAAAKRVATAYLVVSGDSLSGIAGTLGVTLQALLTANKLDATSLIYPGMKLSIPKGGSLPTVAPATHVTAPATKPAAKPAPKPAPKPGPKADAPLNYVVLSGDSLSGIANKLSVTLKALLTANELEVTGFIWPGMRLTVPEGGSLPAPPKPAKTGSATASTAKVTVNSKLAPAIEFALAQVGKPYKFNTAGPDSFDCSGLTMAAFAEIGISLPHYSGAQVNFGTAIDWTKDAIQPGDLVFLESTKGSGIINHVGIAISATQWVHAPRTGEAVRVNTMGMGRVVAVRRLVTP